MDTKRLKAVMIEKGINAERLIAELYNQLEIKMSKSAFYRKIKGRSDFTRTEIMGIKTVLDLSDEQVLHIFFEQKVS